MDMNIVKRYSLIELVLLAIFFIGLLISGLIVKMRSRIQLSTPLELPGSGVTVYLPEGSGWEYTPTWQYEESADCMALISQFRNISGRGIEVRWRYYFSTPAGSENELLQKQADSIGAEILMVGTTGQENRMVYARMISHGATTEEFYVGMLRLDYDRSVELFVKSYGMSSTYEDSVFELLAQSMTYQRPQELEDGRTFLDQFLEKSSRLDSADQWADEAFIINTVQGSAVGYYYAHRSSHTNQDEMLSHIQIRHVDNILFNLKSDLWFSPIRKSYRWDTAIQFPDARGPRSFQLELDENEVFSIVSNTTKPRSIKNVHFFLPEVLLTQAAISFAQSSFDAIVVDVVSASGQFVPVLLTKIEPEQSHARSEQVASVVRMDYLHQEDSYEDLLFDASSKLLGKYEQISHRSIRIWNAADPTELQNRFNLNFQELMNEVARNTNRQAETI